MNKLKGESMDLTKNNIKELQSIFPEVFIDGKIDFKKLKLILGEDIEISDEKYEFKWNGKNDAIKIAQTPSMGTLRPDKESSKNWDNTENLYIEGDNLEVLKLLQKSYFGKIKMIYIDPPYNTGKDFVYKDNFKDNISNYKEVTNQKSKANVETNGRYHTDWLNMMYPRLKLARNLLSKDGIIFISIDDNEISNLKKICDEIFGEDNFIEAYIWNSNFRPDNSSKLFRKNAEYILCYAKNIKSIEILIGIINEKYGMPSLSKSKEKIKEITFPEKTVKTYLLDGVYEKGLKENPGGLQWELMNDIVVKNGVIQTEVILKGPSYWATKDKIDTELKNGTEIWIKSESFVPYYLKQGDSFNRPEKIIPNKIVGDVLSANSELKDLFGYLLFNYPKPISLIKYLIRSVTYFNRDSIILDFFSGSASTGQAVLELNKEDNGNRKFIMVQLSEQTDEKSEAYKVGYKNICEIGKERIRRAGDKIVSETGKTDLDIGFKVFKLDDSNIKTWNPNYNNLEMTLFDMEDNIKEDRTQEDLLYEILLKLGYELTVKIEEVKINDKTLFKIENSLLICLENNIDNNIVEYITKMNTNKDELKVVFKDSGFKSDKDKMNAVENLKQFGIIDVRSV